MKRGNFICLDSLGSSEGVGFAGSISAPGSEPKTAKFTIGAHTKVFTDDGARSRARLRRGRAARGRRQHPGRLLQGRAQVGRDVPHDRRRALVGAGRLRERRGRRHDHAARPRLGGHQLGRREDLPRGGRGGGEGASRRWSTASSSACPTSASAKRSPRSSRAATGVSLDARRPHRARSSRWRATSGRAASCSCRRSCAGPNGKADYKWAKQEAANRP